MIPIWLGGREAPPGIVKYEVQMSDIDSSETGRVEAGTMERERVRHDVAKLQLEWKHITAAELEQITSGIADEFFQVKYFYGDWKTATMYAGDRNIHMIVAGEEQFWTISVNLIEK